MRTAGRWPPLMLTSPTPESSEIFNFGKRQGLGGEGESQNRGVRGINLAVDRWIREPLGKKIGCAVDGGLDFLFGDVDVQVKIELQSDDGAAERARRSHLVQAGNLPELALERGGDRRGHHVRTGARVKRLHLDGGVIDLR